eukprot:2627609-Pleurochrysis_carterae.AAC.1
MSDTMPATAVQTGPKLSAALSNGRRGETRSRRIADTLRASSWQRGQVHKDGQQHELHDARTSDEILKATRPKETQAARDGKREGKIGHNSISFCFWCEPVSMMSSPRVSAEMAPGAQKSRNRDIGRSGLGMRCRSRSTLRERRAGDEEGVRAC